MCEKVALELEVDRMTDMAVDDMVKTKNVLYISRGQLKNHTSTVLNFNIGERENARKCPFTVSLSVLLFCRCSTHFSTGEHAVAAAPASDKQHVSERQGHPK